MVRWSGRGIHIGKGGGKPTALSGGLESKE